MVVVIQTVNVRSLTATAPSTPAAFSASPLGASEALSPAPATLGTGLAGSTG